MIEIRNIVLKDFDKVFELLVKLYENNKINKKTTFDLFKEEFKNKKTFQIVAIYNNDIVGFAAATNRIDYQDQGIISMLTCLIVDENVRGLGIGKKLLSSMESICKVNSSKDLQFSSTFKRVKSHEFYESQGYTKSAYYFWKTL